MFIQFLSLFLLTFSGPLLAKLQVQFIVNEDYLVGHTLSRVGEGHFSSNEHREDIIRFQADVWSGNETGYRLLPNEVMMLPELYSHPCLKDFMQWAKSLPSFQPLLHQAKVYQAECEQEWEETCDAASDYVQSLTGLDFNKTIKVYLSHPSQRNGRYLGNNTLCLGSRGDFDYFDMVYLWHEILHSYLPTSDQSHCVIQFITDNGLRLYFNPEEELFPLIGHDYLDDLMNELYPKWEAYLQRERRNIYQFLHELEPRE